MGAAGHQLQGQRRPPSPGHLSPSCPSLRGDRPRGPAHKSLATRSDPGPFQSHHQVSAPPGNLGVIPENPHGGVSFPGGAVTGPLLFSVRETGVSLNWVQKCRYLTLMHIRHRPVCHVSFSSDSDKETGGQVTLGQGAGVQRSAASPPGGHGTSRSCVGDTRLDLTRRDPTEEKNRVPPRRGHASKGTVTAL